MASPSLHRILAAALAVAGLGMAMAAPPAEVAPVPTQSEEAELARLEEAFWACDYVATTRGVQATPASVCRYVTEQLKQEKFAGSFSRMLEWWKENKAAQHRRLARLEEH